MLIPAQLKTETTDTSMDLSPSNIGVSYMAVRQHKEELELDRVEMLKEEEKGVKNRRKRVNKRWSNERWMQESGMG
jgi:hypothetical protein